MSHRRLVLGNAEWDVWDVRPEARLTAVGTGLEHGWLCFQSGETRRRLVPIPEHWEELDDEGLVQLFRHAREVKPVRTDGHGFPAAERPRDSD